MNFLVKMEDLYCFLYKSNSDKISKSAGWDSFDLEKEFKRMNVPNESWSLTKLNQDYKVGNSTNVFKKCFLYLACALYQYL